MAEILVELPIIDAASQRFQTVLGGRTCTLKLDYSEISDRWYFALSIDDVLVLSGRKILLDVDLIAPFDFGIGKLVALDYAGRGAQPGRNELPSGQVRLYSYQAA